MWPLAAFVVFGLGADFGDSERIAAEHRAESAIKSSLDGTTSQVKVKIQPNGPLGAFGDLEDVDVEANHFSLDKLPLNVVPGTRGSGRIGTLHLRLHDFTLRSLLVEELDADIPASRYDFSQAKRDGKFVFARSGLGTGSVIITQEALQAYILHKFHQIKRCQVTVDKDVIIVEGFGEFLVASTEFTVVARIKSPEGTTLELDGARIFFGIEPADPLSAKALLKILNPVVDLKKDLGLQDAVKVETVELRGGKVTARGRSRIPTKD